MHEQLSREANKLNRRTDNESREADKYSREAAQECSPRRKPWGWDAWNLPKPRRGDRIGTPQRPVKDARAE